MKFDIVATVEPDGSDYTTIARCDWDALPRIGETIKLCGPQFGDPNTTKHGVAGESLFKVLDVSYSDSVDAKGNTTPPADVEVFVERHEVDRPPMQLRCVCEKPREDFSDPDRETCDNCGHLVSGGALSTSDE